MSWYLAKIVYRIICGDGRHTAQFDEQLRLIASSDEVEAYEKAVAIGEKEQETFYNQKQQLVQWQFINVSELYHLSDLIDGAELYSRVHEADDALAYVNFVNWKSKLILQKQQHQFNLIS